MSKKVQAVQRHRNENEVGGYLFFCPGCGENHYFKVDSGGWTFNGDEENPTFSPSLLYPTKKVRCHLFLKKGKIQYLSDCGHELAGKTIDCPDWEE
ncbi:MAG TPA: DUF6527 family protein [Bacillales bacterium]|nr:DUF6527 family protein [Bacillales bacterium]